MSDDFSSLAGIALVVGAALIVSKIVRGSKSQGAEEQEEAARREKKEEQIIAAKKQWEKNAPVREAQQREQEAARARRRLELEQAEAAGHDVCYLHGTIDQLCSRCHRPMCCRGGEYYTGMCYYCDDGG